MTQAERGRLVALKKAKKKPITQKQAAEEIPIPWRAQAGWTKKARIRAASRTGSSGVSSVAGRISENAGTSNFGVGVAVVN